MRRGEKRPWGRSKNGEISGELRKVREETQGGKKEIRISIREIKTLER